ncbi:hypothetical protein ACS0TY_019027 [Phlomoides rotata]
MMNFLSRISPPFLILILSLKLTQCSILNSKLHDFQTELRRKTTAGNSTKINGGVFYPIGYGADPTGAQDSTAAILAALNDAAKLRSGLELLPGITDLGGVVIDLQGCSFSISGPIRFPPRIGNIVF